MRVIIVGAGAVGQHLAARLSKENHDVTLIETDRGRLQKLQDELDVLVVEGNGASPRVLQDAGISRCDLMMAVTNIDEINMVASLSACQFKVPFKISRVSNMDYYLLDNWLNDTGLGVDLLINPEFECALQIRNLLKVPGATDVAEFAGGKVIMAGLPVQEDAPCLGKSLQELRLRTESNDFLIGTITRGGKTIIPTGQTYFEKGDEVYFIALKGALDQIYEFAGLTRRPVRRVMVLGDSREAVYLCKMLERLNMQTALVVEDNDRAEQLAEDLDKTLVIQGESANVELLQLEGLSEADAFLALTRDDEENLLTGLVAKNHKVPVVIALLQKLEYVPLVNKVGVTTAVSSRLAIVDTILKYVRRGNILSMATLKGNRAEVVEFNATEKCKLLGKPLKDLTVPDKVIFGMVTRGQDVFIPTGYSQFEVGDKVVVIAKPESQKRMEPLF